MSKGGSTTSGGATDGVNPANVKNPGSLVSARNEGNREDVDQTLGTIRDLATEYGGANLADLQLVDIDGKDGGVIAYYDNGDNLAFNRSYFNQKGLNDAYDKCTDAGFHPSRGNKTGIEAITAHEYGHKLTYEAAKKMTGGGFGDIDAVARKIVDEARKETGARGWKAAAKKISGYAQRNPAETVAEACSDIYCNGSKASKESKAIMKVVKRIVSS